MKTKIRKYSEIIYGFVIGLTFWIPLWFLIRRNFPLKLDFKSDMLGWRLTDQYLQLLRNSFDDNTSYLVASHNAVWGTVLIYVVYIAFVILVGYLIVKKTTQGYDADVEDKQKRVGE